jgi:hypothetical protein
MRRRLSLSGIVMVIMLGGAGHIVVVSEATHAQALACLGSVWDCMLYFMKFNLASKWSVKHINFDSSA